MVCYSWYIIIVTTGAVAIQYGFFGQGFGPIHLDEVQCIGSERSLILCSFTSMENCNHYEDAGVRCQGIYHIIVMMMILGYSIIM